MMAVKLLTAIACLLALYKVQGVEVNSEGKIKISFYTTAGCGDTVRLITNQVAEAYRLYGQFLDIEFIPWGKTVWGQEEGAVITCQFGTNDCFGNHLQRCVLDILKNNQTAQVEYMTCEFAPPYPSLMLGNYQCAQEVGVNLIELDYCVANKHDDLARQAQAASKDAIGAFNYVPMVVFNDVINREEHDQAETRLSSVICFALAANPDTGITTCQI